MTTFTFAQIASTILASISSSGGTPRIFGGNGFGNPSSLSQFSLKGKLDLSLWKNIGDDEEEEELDIDTEEGEGVSQKKDGSSPQPPPSPVLAPLLPVKKKVESGGDGKITLVPIQGYIRPHSPRPGTVVAGEGRGVSSNDDKRKGESTRENGNNDFMQTLSSSSPSTKFHYAASSAGKKAIEQGRKTPVNNNIGNWSSSARESTTGGLRQQLGFADTIVHLGKPQEQLPPIPLKSPQTPTNSSTTQALLSGFIGSSGLLRSSQLQSGRERERLEKKVEFSIMESKSTEGEPSQQPKEVSTISPLEKKERRVGSGKDGPVGRSRSGSGARRPSAKPQATDILQEIRKMSLASQDALEEKKKAAAADTIGSAPTSGRKFGKKRVKRRKAEEVFTDKDRAAAVTLGSKDIKQSLKAKKKRDRKMRLSINFLSGEDYVIGTLLGEASYQMKVKKQPEAALQTLNKALEIHPNHKGALVARSQCYLKLGDAESALEDAKIAWDPTNPNDNYVQGLYQYAEALYQLGEFEKALIAFHRGHRSRKDMDGFRIGIQKCQEAIKRAIGDKSATSIPNLDQVLPLIQELEDTKARIKQDEEEEGGGRKSRSEEDDTKLLKSIAKYRCGENSGIRLSGPIESKVKSRLITRELMGQLYLDKSYLKKFINRPEVINQQGLAKGLRDEACDALQYLEGREKFWRQQNPLYSRKNFQTMLKAHAHDVACREQSVNADPSIAKYLQRRSSGLAMSGGDESSPIIKRQSSEPRLIGNVRRKSLDTRKESLDRMNSIEKNKKN